MTRTFLARAGSKRRTTVIELIESIIGTTVAEARQVITVDPLPPEMAPLIDMQAGDMVLRIDRVYRDISGTAVEMTTNYFNPSRYSYTLQMRRGTTHRRT
jgi:DNA-binding GntR family transcriptional regulator